MDGELWRELLPTDGGWALTQVSLAADTVVVELSVMALTAVCPSCGQAADRVHSRYVRRLKDQACCGRTLSYRITARRFFCDHSACRRKVFCERLSFLTTRHGRTTHPLTEL